MYWFKTRKKLWITIISVTTLLLIGITIYFLFFRNAGALLSLGRALDNLYTETTERVESTPVKAAVMLPGVLEDGTVTADFSYSNNVPGSWISSGLSGRIELASNTKTRDYTLGAQLHVFNGSYDLDAHINKERMALRLHLLGETYYGIKYDTFRDDVRVFGRLLRLSDQDMDRYADIVDKINEIMNAKEPEEDAFGAYSNVIVDFAKNLDIKSSRRDKHLNDKRVNHCIEIKISKDSLLTLFNELYDTLENDIIMQERLSMYGNYMLPFLANDEYDDYEFSINDIKKQIDNFEENYFGNVTFIFHVDKADRLLRVIINTDFEYIGEKTEISTTLDFGNSITDDWKFVIINSENNETDMLFIQWSYSKSTDTYDNSISIITENKDKYSISSQWDIRSGRYKLTYENSLVSNELTGDFTFDETSFRFSLDNVFPDSSVNKLSFDLLAEPGAQIEKIEFVNIDKWGRALISSVIRLLFGVIF